MKFNLNCTSNNASGVTFWFCSQKTNNLWHECVQYKKVGEKYILNFYSFISLDMMPVNNHSVKQVFSCVGLFSVYLWFTKAPVKILPIFIILSWWNTQYFDF